MAGSTSPASDHRLSVRSAGWVAQHATPVLILFLLVTALLAVSMLTRSPDGYASQEPEGAVFDARDALEERFGSGMVTWFFIIEARDGEMLDRESLVALQDRLRALRADDVYGRLLVERTDRATEQVLAGAVTLSDTVDQQLRSRYPDGLLGADDDAVRTTASNLIDASGPAELGISAQAIRDPETGLWSAPALTMAVVADGSQLAGRGEAAGFASDVAVERAGRDVQQVLRDTDLLDVVGVALDQSLTGGEQGEAAGPFIGFTVLAIVLLVGLIFQSYWTLALVGGALITLLVWLQGLTNLIGLENDPILTTIVPIAMLAFGADYAFHAVGRYREERRHGHAPRPALGRGLGGVVAALLLALATGAFAFLANSVSGIQSIVQFGIAAAIGLVSSFLVLGVAVPLSLMVIEERVEGRRHRWGRPIAVLGGLGAAAAAMVAVLLTVFLSPPGGLALLAGYLVAFVIGPAVIAGRMPRRSVAASGSTGVGDGRIATWLSRLVGGVAARRAIVLPVVGVLSVGAALYAVQVPASFDVEDFFAQDTDFVVGLDKLDLHVGDQGGEEAVVLVTTDLTEPAAISAIRGFTAELGRLDTRLLALGADGEVLVAQEALAILEGSSVLSPVEAQQFVAGPDASGLMAARLGVELVGSRAQENVEAARDLLTPLVTDLAADLERVHPDSEVVLTGTPIVRQASLDAVSRSLMLSVPIAVLLCLLIAWTFMRSLRYALVSLVPILLVIAWLYGFMYLAGFSINLVTATIGAISIGVGIDFALHMTMRYREELRRTPTRLAALTASVAGTGVALAGSTASSVAGFTILAFAPMPMFASFGLLTAVMISLALASSLLVLPGLLLLVSREPTVVGAPTGRDVPARAASPGGLGGGRAR